MKRCEECGKSEVLSEILETIEGFRPRFLCISCALRNNAVILTKPSQDAFNGINSKENIYNRLRIEAGLSPIKTQEKEQKFTPVSFPARQIYPESNVRRTWKTTEEKNLEKEMERKEKELEEIRKKKQEEEEKQKEIQELEDEGKINFKSKFLTILDLKRISEKKKQEIEKENEIAIKEENAINEVMENKGYGNEESTDEENVIKDHNEF